MAFTKEEICQMHYEDENTSEQNLTREVGMKSICDVNVNVMTINTCRSLELLCVQLVN